MKTNLAILLLLFAAACDSQDTTPSPPDVPTAATDLAPARLYEVTPTVSAGPEARSSYVISPQDGVKFPDAIVASSSTGARLVVAPDSAPQLVTMSVDTPEGAFLFLWPTGNLTIEQLDGLLDDVEVHGPDGAKLNRVSATLHDPDSTATAAQHAQQAIALTGLPAGKYTVVLGDSAAKNGLAIGLEEPNATLTLDVTPSQTMLLLGSKASIDVSVHDGATAADAKVEAFVRTADDVLVAALEVAPIGAGTFRASMNPVLGLSNKPGIYTIDVVATGTTVDGRVWQRTGTHAIQFGVPTARIKSAGEVREVRDVDTHKVTAFEVDVVVEVASRDRYEVSGVLATNGADGEVPVAGAQTGLVLEPGQQQVTLSFDAGYVKLAGVEGTLGLRHLQLYSQTTNTVMHRMGYGLGVTVTGVHGADLAEPTMTPNVEEMIDLGQL